MGTFPLGDKEIKLAMLGMVEGNAHPYSWSAIINGYNREALGELSKGEYAGIPVYMFREPPESIGIPGVKVTHVWTDDPRDAEGVSKASLVPNILKRPEDAIGEVDAVIISTDKGYEHVERCRPFVEAGLPMFVDKPLVDNEADLLTFIDWIAGGAHIMSSSGLRYGKELLPYRISTNDLGQLRLAVIAMAKTWEKYGIHAVESLYPILGPGFVSVQNTGTIDRNVVHMKHARGADVIAVVTADMFGGFGAVQLNGTQGVAQARFNDTFYSFKSQLAAFVDYLRSGEYPFPFSETIELMKIIIAGIRSREEGGRQVLLSEIAGEL